MGHTWPIHHRGSVTQNGQPLSSSQRLAYSAHTCRIHNSRTCVEDQLRVTDQDLWEHFERAGPRCAAPPGATTNAWHTRGQNLNVASETTDFWLESTGLSAQIINPTIGAEPSLSFQPQSLFWERLPRTFFAASTLPLPHVSDAPYRSGERGRPDRTLNALAKKSNS